MKIYFCTILTLFHQAGPKTLHFPSNEELSVFDAAMRYKE